MRAQIEDVFLEWQCGLDPEGGQDWVSYEGFEPGLMTVFVWRHHDLDPILLRALENMLQHKVCADLLVSSLVKKPV